MSDSLYREHWEEVDSGEQFWLKKVGDNCYAGQSAEQERERPEKLDCYDTLPSVVCVAQSKSTQYRYSRNV